MIFSKNYSKFGLNIFTTIRKSTGFYKLGNIYKVKTPSKEFKVRLIECRKIDKDYITEQFAQNDADCSRAELIAMLEKWYGKKHDDFVLLVLQRSNNARSSFSS